MHNITRAPLAPWRFAGLQAEVGDEAEIGTAVADLLARVRACAGEQVGADHEIALAYDGSGEGQIVVSVGIPELDPSADEALTDIEIPGAAEGVTVTFDSPPGSVADVWVVLDGHLAQEGLTTTNVYRQVIGADGTTTFAAPVAAAQH